MTEQTKKLAPLTMRETAVRMIENTARFDGLDDGEGILEAVINGDIAALEQFKSGIDRAIAAWRFCYELERDE